MLGPIDSLIRKHFVYWHGEGKEVYQHDFFRCDSCHRLITWKYINKGGCRCGSYKLKPTIPSGWETFKVIVLPWTI